MHWICHHSTLLFRVAPLRKRRGHVSFARKHVCTRRQNEENIASPGTRGERLSSQVSQMKICKSLDDNTRFEAHIPFRSQYPFLRCRLDDGVAHQILYFSVCCPSNGRQLPVEFRCFVLTFVRAFRAA